MRGGRFFSFPNVVGREAWGPQGYEEREGGKNGRNRFGKPLYGFPSSCSGRLQDGIGCSVIVRDAVSLACSCWKPSRPAKRVRPGRCRDRPAAYRPNIGRVRRLESWGRVVQSMVGMQTDHVGRGDVPLMSDDREPATQQARDPVDEHGERRWLVESCSWTMSGTSSRIPRSYLSQSSMRDNCQYALVLPLPIGRSRTVSSGSPRCPWRRGPCRSTGPLRCRRSGRTDGEGFHVPDQTEIVVMPVRVA